MKQESNRDLNQDMYEKNARAEAGSGCRAVSFRAAALRNARETAHSHRLLELEVPADGGGVFIPCDRFTGSQTLAVEIETLEAHCAPFYICFYEKGMNPLEDGCEKPVFWARTGVKPRLPSTWSFEFHLLGRTASPKRTPGRQKLDLAGQPCAIEDIGYLYLHFISGPTSIHVRLSDLRVCCGQPLYHIEHRPLLDELGQYLPADWPGRQPSVRAMASRLREFYGESQKLPAEPGFYASDWNRWGGWGRKKLCAGTGFFRTFHDGKRWWLADPEGYAFFSIGPDCVGTDRETRADAWEHLLTYMPSPQGIYGRALRREDWGDGQSPLFIDYPMLNLMRAFGKDWREKWTELTARRLRAWGFNTVANWSDEGFCHAARLPYVLPLNTKAPFPTTAETIYQDFPDVFSGEYLEKSRQLAQALIPYRDDPFLIGYFLCNEPGWGFEKGLNLGLQLLKSRNRLSSRRHLIAFLQERYRGEIAALNARWHTSFSSFQALLAPFGEADGISQAGKGDLRDFTAVLIRQYATIPSQECRRIDSRHLNLGMRWAFIHDPLLLSGWEAFDVFSLNCYKIDPLPSLRAIAEAGVRKPLIIGEFHHGALDAAHTATGIRGVASQAERGRAYRYYVENAASFQNLVGCHYFTYNDQSALGRMDGECYNIGFVDACQTPYPAMVRAARDTALSLYEVACGERAPFAESPAEIPAVYF